MGWADGHIARLALGETVQFRPRGHSMTGKVNDGQLCAVEPLREQVLEVGDIVLCCAVRTARSTCTSSRRSRASGFRSVTTAAASTAG